MLTAKIDMSIEYIKTGLPVNLFTVNSIHVKYFKHNRMKERISPKFHDANTLNPIIMHRICSLTRTIKFCR